MEDRRNTQVMNRAALTRRVVGKLTKQEAVIGGIGNSNWDLWAAGHRAENFYMLGSMGLAAPIAMGVAIAQPERRVFALEGDGSLLMVRFRQPIVGVLLHPIGVLLMTAIQWRSWWLHITVGYPSTFCLATR